MNEEDFPDLETVYLDSACMSLRPKQVVEKVEEYYQDYPGCPGRSAHSVAKKATEEFEAARKKIARFIDASPDNLVFTSGTTESLNTVARSFPVEKVIISDREHNSNLVPWQQEGKEIEVISTENGFDLEQLEEKVEEGNLVSVVHVSNLDGYELPVEEIVEIARENNAYTMIDAAQSIPHQPFSAEELGADFVAFSGHKMLGPSGTGGLYVSDRVKEKLDNFMVGGGSVKDSTYSGAEFQGFPQRMEAGLPNLAGFIGLGRAVEYLENVGMEKIQGHEEELTEKMYRGLKEIEGVELVGREGTGIASFRVEGVDPHQTAVMLDQRNIAVRSGRHCVHSWFNDRGEEPNVRASLHLYNNEEDIDEFLDAMEQIALLS